MVSPTTLECSGNLALGITENVALLYYTGAALTFAAGAVPFPLNILTVSLVLAVVVGLLPALGFKQLAGAAKCLYEQYIIWSNNSGGCVSGSRNTKDEKCKPCPKIYGAKDENGKMYKDNYENDDGYKPKWPSVDPINVGSFTNYICSENISTKPPGSQTGTNDIQRYTNKVFAMRQYPYGGCEWIEEGDDADPIKGTFLTNDPKECNKLKWEDIKVKNNSGPSGSVDGAWELRFKRMQHQHPEETSPCKDSLGLPIQCDDDMWIKNTWHRTSNWFSTITESEDVFKADGPVADVIENAWSFDNANVCKDSFILSGTYLDQIGGEDANEKNDPKDKVKNHIKEEISNHCCPKIIGSEECPHHIYNTPVNLYTETSSSGQPFNESAFNPLDPGNEGNVKECYMYDYSKYDEFFPPKYGEGENQYITDFRYGGVQCGPRHLGNENSQIESIKPFLDPNVPETDETEYLDIMRPDNHPRPTNYDSSSETSNLGVYYGTRFKLDNRYKYTPETDSGATGYEYYLDPEDYVTLGDQSNLISQLFNTEFTNDLNNGEVKLTQINKHTTINDIIPRQLGHEDRKQYLCENYQCNDIEKTKYIQTIYDGFCTGWRRPGAESDTRQTWTKDNYKKFFRPIGIEKDGVGGENMSSPEKSMYSDICCDPIPFSLRSSFIGCDAAGKNPYFIDSIFTDPSPIYPKHPTAASRRKLKPRSRQNLNQCIPSMEDKCYVDREKATKYLGDRTDFNIQEYNDIMDSCNHKLDESIIKKRSPFFDDDSNPGSLQSTCSTGTDQDTGSICQGVLYRELFPEGSIYTDEASPYYETQYWLYNSNPSPEEKTGGRKAYGYAPYKGELNNFERQSSTPFDFTLRKPTDAYTECNVLPHDKSIRDIEIYDKNIDWDPNEKKIRFKGENPPKDTSKLFKLMCDKNYKEHIGEPILEGGDYYYEVECIEGGDEEADITVYS